METWSSILVLALTITAATSRQLISQEEFPKEAVEEIQRLVEELVESDSHQTRVPQYKEPVFAGIPSLYRIFRHNAGDSKRDDRNRNDERDRLTDLLCRATGQCGKSSADKNQIYHRSLINNQLGIERNKDTTNFNMENIFKQLNKALAKTNEGKRNDQYNLRCKGDVCELVKREDERKTENDNVNRYLDDIKKHLGLRKHETLRDEDKVLNCEGLRCGCQYGRCGCNSVRCGCSGDRCQLEDDDTSNVEKLANRNKIITNDPKRDGKDLKAKIIKINDHLDAIVVDVSNLDDILHLLQENLDKDPTRTKDVRYKNVQAMRGKRLLPQSLKQMGKRKIKLFRRSVNSNEERYGLPFELEIKGLAQANP